MTKHLRLRDREKVLFIVIAATAFGILAASLTSKKALSNKQTGYQQLGMFNIPIPEIKYGFALDTFNVVKDEIKDHP